MKLTADQIMEWECDALIEALGCELELNDEFLAAYCADWLREILQPMSEYHRAEAIHANIEAAWFNGSPASLSDGIVLPHGEIEYQFEGDPEDVFDDPDDFTFNGDLAYLYTGYGLSIDLCMDTLVEYAEKLKHGADHSAA